MTAIHTFAIGDIHGRADLLEPMLEAIDFKATRLELRYQVIFLGDIIDRGPDSRTAMDLVARTLSEIPGSRLILGNHDSYMLRILDEPDPLRTQALVMHWIAKMGGGATLASYGFDFETGTIKSLRSAINPLHVAMLRGARPYIELDKHVLVHAGLEPGIQLELQDPYQMMWIREPFLSYERSFGKCVVHGHTPTAEGFVQRYPNRVAVDTGAYESGRLSALHLHPDGTEEVLSAQAADRRTIYISHGYPVPAGHGMPMRKTA